MNILSEVFLTSHQVASACNFRKNKVLQEEKPGKEAYNRHAKFRTSKEMFLLFDFLCESDNQYFAILI